MADLSGTTLGQYQILNELGAGGMATVYRGMQTSIDREVAIKVLPTHFLQDRTFLERFEREVQVIAHLQHPRIVPVYDFGEIDGQPFIVMAMMHGGTLADRLHETDAGLPLDQTLTIIEQIAEGLDFAHKRGVVHRDLKPGNILFDEEDNIFLSDFGIAKVSETTAHLTGSGLIGTPTYMAPELADQGTTSPLVDVYALGVTLFQMLTGQVPYEADTPLGVLLAHVNNPIPWIEVLRTDLPDDVQKVIEGAMSKDPAARYQSAGAVAADLWRVMNGEAIEHYMTRPLDPPAASSQHPRTMTLPPDEMPVRTPAPRQVGQNQPVTTPSSRKRPVWLFGLGAVLLIVALVAVLATGLISFGGGAVPAADQPETLEETQAPTQAPQETVGITPTAFTLEPSAEALAGLVEWQAAVGSFFTPISGDQPLAVGDHVRTDDEGRVVLTFAPGVFAEVLGSSEVSFDRYEDVDGRIVVEVRQFSGKVRYTILPNLDDLELDFILHTPDAVIYDLGTVYWADLQEGGWCFKQVDGSILVELGEADDNTEDDHLLVGDSDTGLLLTSQSELGECVVDESVLEVVELPTPTTAAASGGASGESGSGGSSAPTSVPTTTGSTLCSANGGIQWQGTTCVCPGFVDEVTVCTDGTKLDSLTENECVPTSSCDTGGSGGGGGGGGGGNSGGPCNADNDCSGGQICLGNVCTTPSSCTTDSDCPNIFTCVNNKCVP